MALTFTHVGDTLLASIDALAERGASVSVQAFWRRAIVDRTFEAAKAFPPLVRLVRALALMSPDQLSPSAYVQALYLEIDVFRAGRFRSAFLAGDRAAQARMGLQVEAEGVRLTEAAFQVGRAAEREGPPSGFELTYRQMPKLAALLDILHNSLGYATVADHLAPLGAPEPEAAAVSEAARALRNAFNAWLEPHLESAHRRVQAKAIEAFLAKAGARRAESVDDEMILRFWESRAAFWRARISPGAVSDPGAEGETSDRSDSAAAAGADPRPAVDRERARRAAADEGFRLFASAARLLLHYRGAMELAEAARALDRAEPLSTTGGGDGEDGLSLDWLDADALAVEGAAVNPLTRLLTPPADQVKWLSGAEIDRLRPFFAPLAKRSAARGAGEAAADPDAEPADATLDPRPLDAVFVRTLLRLDVFAPAQARLLSQLRRGAAGAEAVDAAMAAAPDDAYADAIDGYANTRAALLETAEAALARLWTAGHPAAISLVSALCDPSLKPRLSARLAAVVGAEDDAFDAAAFELDSATREALAAELAALQGEAGFAALFAHARRSLGKVNRVGFRRRDADDPTLLEALAQGAPELPAVRDALERLLRRAPDRAALIDWARADKDRFRAVFVALHGDPEDAASG